MKKTGRIWIGRIFMLLLAAAVLLSAGQPARAQDADPDELWQTAEEAYLYSYPLVLMYYTAQTLPENQLVHARKLATPENKSVVTMNVDTLYSQIMMNLQDEPMILTFPESDRYMQIQVMDAWSNTAAVISEAGVYAFTRTGSDPELPEGVRKIEIPTRLCWCIGRTLLKGNDDLPNVIALQDAMDFRPLHSYLSGEDDLPDVNAEEGIRKDVVPVKAVAALTAGEFFGLANRLMAENSPAAADAEILERISGLGVGPGMQFDASVLEDDADGTGWKNMLGRFYADIQADAKNYARALGKWSYFGEPIGNFGTEYVYRAAIAVSGFGANPVEVALYSRCAADEDGNAFSGAEDYVIHFSTLPPILEKGFWSVTAYNNEDFLIANPLNRYNVNSFSEYTLNEDGSLDVLLTAKDAAGSGLYVLPTDPEGFHLFMRIYMPDTEALAGWTAPVITIAGASSGQK